MTFDQQPTADDSTCRKVIDAPYILADGPQEVARLRMLHESFRHLFNGNYMYKRLENPQRILEVGTGPGSWIIEMAQDFPDCQFTGIDITPFLAKASIPSNIDFKLMNVLRPLEFPDNIFDYVHQRLFDLAIPKDAWPTVIGELARVCTADGVVELCETDAVARDAGPCVSKAFNWLIDSGSKHGMDVAGTLRIPELVRDLGLRMVEEHYLRYPMGEWAGEGGRLGAENMYSVMINTREQLIADQVTTEAEFDEVMSQFRAECEATHAYLRFGIFIVGK